MSNLIPPLLSDTPPPPPLDDQEDDDEFGDFAGSNNLSIDCEESYSPPGTPLEIPTVAFDLDPDPTLPNKPDIINSNNNKNVSVTKDFHDKRKSLDSPPLLNGMVEDLTLSEHVIINDTAQIVTCNDVITETNCDIQTTLTNTDQPEVKETCKESSVFSFSPNQVKELSDKVVESDTIKQFEDVCNKVSIVNDIDNKALEENIDKAIENVDAFTDASINIETDDVWGFNSAVSNNVEFSDFTFAPTEELKQIETETNLDDDFGDFTSTTIPALHDPDKFPDFSFAPTEELKQIETETNLDDDFGDFTSTTIPAPHNQDEFDDFASFSEAPQPDDDFGDFASISTTSVSKPPSSKVLLLDEKQALEKSTEIVKEMFPVLEEAVADFEGKVLEENDKIFNQIKNITETHALAYQWSKSASQNLLLKALNIDSRNILYGPGWNPSMPRFAANLSLTPLEPVKSEILTPIPVREPQKEPTPSTPSNLPQPGLELDLGENIESLSTKESNPIKDPPKDIPSPTFEPTAAPPSKLHLEEQQDDFDDFVSYSTPREIPLGHSIILRETHISNKESDIVNWLEPTIVTPELARKDRPFVEPEEEFDEFQMVVVPEEKPATVSVGLKVQPLEPAPVAEDDFGDFTSYSSPTVKPVVLLQPTVLETKSTAVSWPDPGITDDEISRFEALGQLREQSKKPSKDKNSPAKKQNSLEDDEWSDFVSVNQSPVHKLKTEQRCSTPDLPLSVLNLGSVQPTKQPIPVITPNGLVQTKLSSKVSKNVTPQSSKAYPQIQNNSPHFQPSIISNQYGNYMANSNKPTAEDDEWSDFVSHQSQPNITTNLGDAFAQKQVTTVTKKVTRGTGNGAGVSSVSVDFLAPRQQRTTSHRK